MNLACTALASIVCSMAQATNGPFESGAVLAVRGEHGYDSIVDLDLVQGPVEFPVPLLSRSERVRRAALTNQGLSFRVFAGTRRALAIDGVSVEALRHPVDAQVLIVGGEAWLVGPPQLPLSITRPDSPQDELLPELARQDHNSVRGAELVILPPTQKIQSSIVLIGAERESSLDEEHKTSIGGWMLDWSTGSGERSHSLLPHGTRQALVLEASSKPLRLALGDARLDQLFYAGAHKVDAVARTRLSVRTALRSQGRVADFASWRGEGESFPIVERAAPQDAIGDATRTTVDAARPFTLARGEMLELTIEPPPPAEDGFTWTLLVKTSSTPSGEAHASAQASAARGAHAASPALFRDVARAAGIDFIHMEGPDEQLDIRPTMGPGAAWGDVDGDGWVDLFLVQGGGREGSKAPHSKLFKNLGDGRFRDATDEARLAVRGAGMGALFFDADGDLDLDLFVANYGKCTLHQNDGSGRFEDASAAMPAIDRWHAAPIAADYDRDGDLDLYVTSYLTYDEASMPPAEEFGRYRREDPIAMLPFAFRGAEKIFLRNDSRRTDAKDAQPTLAFTDHTAELGLTDAEGRGMQAVFWDFDRDGDQDLYLANDVSPNRLWRNEGDGRFKDVSFAAGLDDPRGSMGLAAGDIDGDGDEDVCVTNWQLEANALYVNNLVNHKSAKSRVASFRDHAIESGIGAPSVGVTKWGVELADFDNDGDVDLFYANGYTSPDYESTGICVGQPNHYFENDGEGRFTVAFERAGPDAAIPLASRGAVACDYDQDGDLDLIVTANNGRARLLENTTSGGHWLGVRLRGKAPNPHAIGAEVTVRAGERTLRRSLRAGTSYLCGNAPELHFGLGAIDKIDEVVVRWPSGRETKHGALALNRFVLIAEP